MSIANLGLSNSSALGADAYSAAQNYVANVLGQGNNYINLLNGMTSTATSITFDTSWASPTDPAVTEVAPIDSGLLPVISLDLSGVYPPTPFTGVAPGVSIDSFTEVDPTTNFGTAPTLSYGSVPTIPTISSITVPDAPTLSMPSAPSLLNVETVAFGGVDLHTGMISTLETIPTLTLAEPTPYSWNPDPSYASELLTELSDKLRSRIAGGTGLAPAVEQAIWDRARDRETTSAQANIDEIQRQSDALGFDLPSGVMIAQMRDVQQNYYDKLSELSRDVAVKQAELEQANLKDAIPVAMQLEGKLIDYSYQMEQLAFNHAKQLADNSVQIYNAGVENYKALLSGYQTYAMAYKTIIEGEMTKVEIYKAELQAELTKVQVNTAMVEQYKSMISAQMAYVDIYKAQVSAAETLVQMEQAKISAAGEQVKAYVAQVNAEVAKIEAYKAGVQAEATKVEVYRAKVQAYSAKVGAQGDKAKAELGAYSAQIQAKVAEWDGYKAQVGAAAEKVRALGMQSGAVLDAYKAQCAATEANAKIKTSVWETKIKDYEARKSIANDQTKIAAEMEKTNRQLIADANKTAAQTYAQLAASALGQIHTSVSMGRTVSYNYSNETTSAVSPQA